MKDRRERLMRMLRAVRQLKRMQQGRMQELEAERARLSQRRAGLLRALEGEAFRGPAMGEALRRALDEAARLERRLREEGEQGRKALKSRHMQERHIERMKKRAESRHREERERISLLDAVELALQRPPDGGGR